MCHSQFLQMVDTCLQTVGRKGPLFRQSKKLTFIGDSRRGIHRHVAMMHLIDNHVAEILHFRTFVGTPALRVSLAEINDGGSFAVHSDSLCPDSRGFVEPFAPLFHPESIKLAVELAGHGRCPCAVGEICLHLNCLVRRAGLTVIIKIELNLLCFRTPEAEAGGISADSHFKVFSVVGGIGYEPGIIGAAGNSLGLNQISCKRKYTHNGSYSDYFSGCFHVR